jgi:hypothetical protein
VAGTAALVRSYYPALSAREVAERLMGTADQPSTPLPNKLIGYGVVDPFSAVTIVRNVDAAPTPAAEDLTVPKPQAPDEAPANKALWLVGGVTAAALLLAGPTVAAAARRRRAA